MIGADLVGHRDHGLQRLPAVADVAAGRRRLGGPAHRGARRRPRPRDRGRRVGRSHRLVVPSRRARAAPRSSVIACRTSGRSKNRSTPRTTNGTPRSDSASSKFSDWALMRNSTAMSAGAVPRATSAADLGGDRGGLLDLVAVAGIRDRATRRRGRLELDGAAADLGRPSRCWRPR